MVFGKGNSQEKKDLKSEVFSNENLMIIDQILRSRKLACPRLPLASEGSYEQFWLKIAK